MNTNHSPSTTTPAMALAAALLGGLCQPACADQKLLPAQPGRRVQPP